MNFTSKKQIFCHLVLIYSILLNCFLTQWKQVIRKRYKIREMNISKRLPPMPTKSGTRIQTALQKILNQDNSLFKVISKPLSKQSVQLNDSDNQEIIFRKERKISIQKMFPRCRSSKNISQSRSVSSEKSVSKLSKQSITGKQMANLPYITAKSWALFQVNTNKLIYGKKQDIRREVASLTKIANLITILEILSEFSLDSNRIMVSITKQAASVNGTTAQIKQGMIFSLASLFYGMMLPSGNDAAYQIAQVGTAIINLARENEKLETIVYDQTLLSNAIDKHSYNVIVYLNRMNLIAKFKAKTISTSFANPHGLSNVNSLSTAEDMAKLSAFGLRNDKFRQVVQTKYYSCKYTKFKNFDQVNDENLDPNVLKELQDINKKSNQYIKSWQNTNKMLWRGFSGIKTGITPNAGPCLSASVKKTIDGKQYEFIMILLKSFSMDTRWKEVEGLAEWACQLMKK